MTSEVHAYNMTGAIECFRPNVRALRERRHGQQSPVSSGKPVGIFDGTLTSMKTLSVPSLARGPVRHPRNTSSVRDSPRDTSLWRCARCASGRHSQVMPLRDIFLDIGNDVAQVSADFGFDLDEALHLVIASHLGE